MQALLSFDQAPPFAAPFRFFLTAPLFAVVAGLVLAVDGAVVLESRWQPALLAITHLIVVGFMLQVMLGALIQVLPVVAGGNIAHPLLISRLVSTGLGLGCLTLAWGFYSSLPGFLLGGALLAAIAVFVFVAAAALALRGVRSSSPTIAGLKISLCAVSGTIFLGLVLISGLLGISNGFSTNLVDSHAAWGLGAWGGGILAALAYVVVPMFQLTPGYATRPAYAFPWLLLVAAFLGAVGTFFDENILLVASQLLLSLLGLAFLGVTWWLQTQRRRAKRDVTFRYWQGGLICSCLGLLLLVATLFPALPTSNKWSLVCGVFVLPGGFMSFVNGMLYKIGPFLAWLHLQNRGAGFPAAPPMGQFLPEPAMRGQLICHGLAIVLLEAAVLWSDIWGWLAHLAGAIFALANGWLWLNLWRLTCRYRQHFSAHRNEEAVES